MAVLGRSRSGGPPPDQILDPPLKSHVEAHQVTMSLSGCDQQATAPEIADVPNLSEVDQFESNDSAMEDHPSSAQCYFSR